MPKPAYIGAKQQAGDAVRTAVESGRLVRPPACERCERVGEVHAHHADYAKPLEVEWLCRHCHAAEHRVEPAWVVAARELRGQGHTYKAIAGLLGHDQTSVYKRLNRAKAQEWARKSNAKRRAVKQEHENKRKRDLSQRGTCKECRRPMGIGVAHDGICSRCRATSSHLSEAEIERARLVERWWAEGLPLLEIADRLGISKGSLGGRMDHWRTAGFDLPYRYGPGKSGHKHSVVKKPSARSA